jgi:hypothetical protein
MAIKFDPFQQLRDRRQKDAQWLEERHRQQGETKMKERARTSYIASGGRPEDFEGEWLQIRRDVLRDAMINSARGK